MFAEIDRLRHLRVRDVMAKQVVEISAHATMEEAAAEFDAADISSAPVIDEHGRCVGMLSAADYLRRDRAREQAGESGGTDPHQLQRPSADEPLRIVVADDAVGRFMSGAVQSIASDTPLLEAARMMCNAHLHRLPVLEEERVVGIVSTMDVVAALVNVVDEADSNRLRSPSK